MNNKQTINPFYRWGQMRIRKLCDDEIDLNRLRKTKPMLVDEPLFLSTVLSDQESVLKKNNETYKNKNDEKRSTKKPEQNNKQIQINLQPTIDSYIINTIKLNRILKNNLTFEQIEFFMNKTKKETKVKKFVVNTDDEARKALKQFIVIMSLHSGFADASALAFDILVEVLDDYISNIFKVLKNLQNIHQADPNKNDPKTSLIQYNRYSNELFTKQVFEELGIGTIEEIRNFYQTDIINYHQDTFKKVSKLYDDYKARKIAEKLKFEVKNANPKLTQTIKTEGEIKVEEFIRENDFLNDESNMILEELLTDLNEAHFDEDMSRLLQMIGSDPFSLIPDDHL